jgi:hypothetical protein
MARTAGFRAAFAAVVASLLLTAVAAPARAQAWLPAQGEGSVSLMYQDVFVKDHMQTTTPVDGGQIWTKTLLLDVTYGVTDKLAITFAIPWTAGKFVAGDNGKPHPLVDLSGPTPVFYGVQPLDDGAYHQTFSDFRFDVRYNITKKWLVLTPFIGTITPSHDYISFAHASPGQKLNELQVGVSGAKQLDTIVPGLFVQGRYAYGFTQQVLDIPHNRSDFGLEVGYFATPRLRLLALSSARLTHGGIDMPPSPRANLPALQFLYHDQIQREDFLNVGGGASFALSDKVDLFGSLIHTAAARNGHAIDRGLSVGVSWSFSTGRGGDRAIASADRSLARCLCEKRTS